MIYFFKIFIFVFIFNINFINSMRERSFSNSNKINLSYPSGKKVCIEENLIFKALVFKKHLEFLRDNFQDNCQDIQIDLQELFLFKDNSQKVIDDNSFDNLFDLIKAFKNNSKYKFDIIFKSFLKKK